MAARLEMKDEEVVSLDSIKKEELHVKNYSFFGEDVSSERSSAQADAVQVVALPTEAVGS